MRNLVLAISLTVVALAVCDALLRIPPGEEKWSTRETLQISQVLIRHGARTPFRISPYNTYPNDPHRDDTYEPYGYEQLTNAGKKELYEFGQELRVMYGQLLGDYYTNEGIIFKSTNSSRTIMSAQMVAAGMFPPLLTALEWSPHLNWQPIPIFMLPHEMNKLLDIETDCPAFTEDLALVMARPEVQKEMQALQPLFQNLSQLTGMNISTTLDVFFLYTNLRAQQELSLQLPPWTKEYFSDMEYVAALDLKYNCYTPKLLRLQAGYLLRNLVQPMQQFVEGTLQPKGRKLFVYCMHDMHLKNLLTALDKWQPVLPNFTASILMELHKNPHNQQYHVEIYYRSDPKHKYSEITLRECSFQCPFEKFIALTADLMPQQSIEEFCN